MTALTDEEKKTVDKLEAELKVVIQPERLLVNLIAIIRRLDAELTAARKDSGLLESYAEHVKLHGSKND